MIDNKIESILEKHSNDYNSWIITLNRYIQEVYLTLAVSNEEAIKQIYDILSIFKAFILSSIEYGSYKDTFDYDKFYQNFYGPELIINSQKTGTQYFIGLDDGGIYVHTHLMHGAGLRHMDDKFWQLLLTLNDYGAFELIQYEHVGEKVKKKYPELFNTKKSVVFRILRKYFADYFNYETSALQNEVIGELGILKVSWNSDFKIDRILEECCKVFKVLYKLNYELWKIEDLKSKSKRKKFH